MAPRRHNKHATKAGKAQQVTVGVEGEEELQEQLAELRLEEKAPRQTTSPDAAKKSTKSAGESLVGKARLQAAFYPKFENESSDQAVGPLSSESGGAVMCLLSLSFVLIV